MTALPFPRPEPAATAKCAAALDVIRRMTDLSERRSLCSPALFAIRPTVLKHMGKKNAPRRLDEAVRLLDATFASALQFALPLPGDAGREAGVRAPALAATAPAENRRIRTAPAAAQATAPQKPGWPPGNLPPPTPDGNGPSGAARGGA